jgi:hypothetical protein
VNGIDGLVPLLNSLNIKHVYEALDSDKNSNRHVSAATDRLHHVLESAGIRCSAYVWDSQFKGVDNYFQFCRWLDSAAA